MIQSYIVKEDDYQRLNASKEVFGSLVVQLYNCAICGDRRLYAISDLTEVRYILLICLSR